jgi:predicted RNA-binding protein (virulence factor B family)
MMKTMEKRQVARKNQERTFRRMMAYQKKAEQMEKDAEAVMKVIEEFEGVLPFNDKVSPEIIKREFGLSKNAFKRAVGRLLKQGRIEITENRIIKR